MSRFYFGQDSDSDSDSDPLPYPQPLQRSAFLAPDFDPTTFLASLHDRHQTLEDLRDELRARGQALNKELLDLVNADYRSFLFLGGRLNGGKERVEEVRIGLLGFKRELEGLRDSVRDRRKTVESLETEKRRLAGQVRLGRGLLEVETRLEELEASLGLGGEEVLTLDFSDSEDEGEGEGNGHGDFVPVSKLATRVQHYVGLIKLRDKLGAEHPFLVGLEQRLNKARQTLLLDLAAALRGCRVSGDPGGTMKMLELYKDLDASAEALKAIKSTPT